MQRLMDSGTKFSKGSKGKKGKKGKKGVLEERRKQLKELGA